MQSDYFTGMRVECIGSQTHGRNSKGFLRALETIENLENHPKSSMHGKIMEFEKTLNNHGKNMEFHEII